MCVCVCVRLQRLYGGRRRTDKSRVGLSLTLRGSARIRRAGTFLCRYPTKGCDEQSPRVPLCVARRFHGASVSRDPSVVHPLAHAAARGVRSRRKVPKSGLAEALPRCKDARDSEVPL